MRMPTLETPRLIIRPFVLSDLPACHELLDIDSGDGGSLEEREQWLRWTVLNVEQLAGLMQPPYGDRAVMVKGSDRLIGAAGLVPCILPLPRATGAQASAYRKRHAPELGLYYLISSGDRGQGYATEAARALMDWALKELQLERVIAMTAHDNLPSQRVMERLGMRIERNPNPDPPWLQVIGVMDALS
jgi:[ribosomal protein S5]-alanine N-acetyltransferase